MLEIQSIVLNPFDDNTYIVWCPATKLGVLIDPGACTEEEEMRLAALIDELDVRIVHLLLTHTHLDHVFGVEWAVKKFGVQPQYHALEHAIYQDADRISKQFGLAGIPYRPAGEELEHGQVIQVGRGSLSIRHVPGHSPGSVIFYNPVGGWALVGDTVEHGGIGRTDLPGSNHDQLISAIREQIFTLPPQTLLYTGHGEATTVAVEVAENPFFVDAVVDVAALAPVG